MFNQYRIVENTQKTYMAFTLEERHWSGPIWSWEHLATFDSLKEAKEAIKRLKIKPVNNVVWSE